MTYVSVEVDVDISDFDTEDLLDELERRGESSRDVADAFKVLVETIYQKRRTDQDYTEDLNLLIYNSIGRI
jgi:hypothetical protein